MNSYKFTFTFTAEQLSFLSYYNIRAVMLLNDTL